MTYERFEKCLGPPLGPPSKRTTRSHSTSALLSVNVLTQGSNFIINEVTNDHYYRATEGAATGSQLE